MPYKVSGSNVMAYKGGKWRVKYRHKSKRKAHAQLAALRHNDPHSRISYRGKG